MRHIALLHYVGATQKSRSVVATIVADLRESGHKVSVVDLGKFTTISQELPPAWLVRLLGHRLHTKRFSQVLLESGATLHALGPVTERALTPPKKKWPEVEQAIESELLTYFRRQSLDNPSTPMRALHRRLLKNSLATFAALHHWLIQNNPDEILVPNGRTSRQRISRVCAEGLGIPIKYYENGRARKNSYYLGKTQPHDRVASQAEVMELTERLSPEEISRLARDWLCERRSSRSATNQFSRSWKSRDGQDAGQDNALRAVFFTSSADEFEAFGPMWNIDSWQSQFEAFDLIMTQLSEVGCEMALRVHPNLVDKSRKYFKSTVEEIEALKAKHPELVVHWHNSDINSYELVESADYVIAERSTIALESSLLGKPVWINQAAQWDQIADVRQFLSPEHVTASQLEPWDVNPGGAERFVAYWMIQEWPLKYSWDEWGTWDSEEPPTRLRLARLLVRNPWFHYVHLVNLEWSRLLNRRFTAS